MSIHPLTTSGRNARLFFHSDFSSEYSGFDLIVTLVPPAGEPTDIDNVQRDNVQCTKMLHDAQILIERNGRTYTITGQEIVR